MNVLILGVSGMLGHKLFQMLKATRHQTAGVMRPLRSEFADYEIFDDSVYEGIDVTKLGSLDDAIQDFRPDAIVNCMGLIRPRAVDPEETLAINSLFPHQLARIASSVNSRLIQVSTDGVFSGQHGNYREQNAADANDLYGTSKLLGEVTYGGHLTLRASLIGRELKGRRNLLGWILSQNGDIPGFTNAVCTPLTTVALSHMIIDLLEKEDVGGLIHLGGERIDKYSMLQMLIEEYHLSTIRLLPYQDYYVDRSLALDRMKQLGYRVDSFEEMVRGIHEEDSWYPPVSSGGHVEMPTAVAVSGQDDRFDKASKKKATGSFGGGAVVGGQVPELSLIVPCFDEGYRLNTLLPELAEICSNSDLTVETIILDDYVNEESPSVAQILQPQYPELHIRVLRRKLSRRGYGAVIRYGLGYAVGKFALCVDVNGIDPVHLIPDMLDQARKGAYLVQCSRYLDPEHVQGISLKYRLYQRVYRTMVRATMGRTIPDSTYAFKLFDRSYVMGLGLTSNRFNFSPEITFKLLLDGASVTSIAGSHGRFGDIQPRFRLVSEFWGFLYVFVRASLHRVGILWF